VVAYTDPGFGHFLSTDADLRTTYHEQTGAYLADLPRVVNLWRRQGFAARHRFSPAEAETWLEGQSGTDEQDLVDLRTLAAVWMSLI
jgi:hypothetical protein